MGIGLKGFMVYKGSSIGSENWGSGIDVYLCIGIVEMGLGFSHWCSFYLYLGTH